MAQIRVHEIAKKLGLDNREVLLTLRKEGIPVASNLSLVDESCVDLMKKAMARPKKVEPKKKVARAPRKKPVGERKTVAKKVVRKAARKAVKKAARKVAAPAAEPASPQPSPQPPAPVIPTAPASAAPPAPPPPDPTPRQTPAPPVRAQAPAPPRSAAQAPATAGLPPADRPLRREPVDNQKARAARPSAESQRQGSGMPQRPPASGPFSPRPQMRHVPPRPGAKFPPRRFGPARRGPKKKTHDKQAGPKLPPPPPQFDTYKPLTAAEGTTVRDLAERMGVKSTEILTRLIARGVMATINLSLDPEMAATIAKDFGFELQSMGFEDHALMEEKEAQPEGTTSSTRPPIVTIMGHVDHGKTTLLDALRESNVVASEHGGITQHIGAYTVQAGTKKITFLDTPGHEAFTLMRARGAQVTDIVILVVAADDGVMPQTIEAINHAKAANVPIIVAINKMDKPDANPDRVKKELANRDLLVESWGGDVVSVEISAKNRQGLNDVLEMILLVSDMKEYKAATDIPGSGTVIEASLDKARGSVATVLVQQGTLKVGDAFIAGSVTGKVRAMFDDRGRKIETAGPSEPVVILGLQGVPLPGDRFKAVEDDAKARQIVSYRQQKDRDEQMRKSSRMTLESLHDQIKEGNLKELNIVLKGDVQGSIEAVAATLARLSNDEVKLRFIHQAVGAINESDVLLATTSDAIVLGFNVRPDANARALAEKEGVDLRLHTVIYELVEQIQKAMVGLLDPTLEEKWLGRAEIRETFKVPKVGVIAGTFVLDGQINRNAEVRLLRDNVVVYTGKIASLRRFKDDVSEVKSGYECGIAIGNFSDVKVGDVIEAFRIEKVAPTELAV
jgi:translation initiation factor IF-2